MSSNFYDKETDTLIPIAGIGKFPADYGTKEEFETKKDSLPDGTVFTTTDEFVDAYTENYSTDEKVIGTWIDGRHVYSKTFSSTSWTPNTELLNDVDVIVSFDGMYKYTQLGVYMNLSYRDTYGSFRIDLNPTTHKVILNCVGSDATFTIKYVKTI